MAEEDTSSLIAQRQIRLEKVEKLRKMGIDPYPSNSSRTHNTVDITDKFDDLNGKEVTVVGRLMSWREHGHIAFGDLVDQSGKVQLYIKDDVLKDTNDKEQIVGFKDLELIDIGDFVEITGEVTKTERGQISVLAKTLKVLEKTIRPLPEK